MSDASLRVDRWLWFTRFYKTRSAASTAVHGGHVRVNGEPAKAATLVKAGDRVRLKKRQLTWELIVTAVPTRRGPAKEARACYEESDESISRRMETQVELRRDRMQMPMTKGRPDKHTRRRLRQRNRGE